MFKKVIKSKTFISVVAVLAVIFIYVYFSGGGKPNLETAKAERRTITQTVSETGNVKPVQSVDLAFQVGGRIAGVYVEVGDRVAAGQVLVKLDASQLNTQLAKTKADLQTQNANLDGSRTGLTNYYGDIYDTINSAYASVNNAIRVKIDDLFTGDETASPQLTFTSNNSQYQNDSQYQRLVMRDMLNSWIQETNTLSQTTSTDELRHGLTLAQSNLFKAQSFLDTLMNAVLNALTISTSTTEAYKSDVSSARSEVSSAISSISALNQSILAQEATINSEEAGIQSYEASVQNIKVQIANTTLSSPIAGVITTNNAKVGEVAVPNAVLVSVISDSKFEIDTNIPEVDIAKVAVGNRAQVTLDAYGNNVVFDAVVTSIDPGETIIEGVATYLTKLQFVKPDSRIKSGMTANIDIVSAIHNDVISVPQRAVEKRNNQEYVLIYTPQSTSSTEERSVTVGLHGNDGYLEVTSGLNEGEEVVIPKPSS